MGLDDCGKPRVSFTGSGGSIFLLKMGGDCLVKYHDCPVFGCWESVAQSKLMCWNHWNMVPPYLASRVYEAYRNGPGSKAHIQACAEAVAYVETRIGLKTR